MLIPYRPSSASRCALARYAGPLARLSVSSGKRWASFRAGQQRATEGGHPAIAAQKREACHPTATRLNELGRFGLMNAYSAKNKTAQTDFARVNIVSDELCDDVVKYLGSSLDRHIGCDIIDIHPGSCLWSQALNKVLKPRSHILFEPDAKFYQPFISELPAEGNYKVCSDIPLNWLAFRELCKRYLDHHKTEPDGSVPFGYNDKLLITGNLASFPARKAPMSFGTMSALLMYHFLADIRQGTIFQQYGSVRTMMWVSDDEKRATVPRLIQRRRRTAIEAEMTCDWINLVVAKDDFSENSEAPGSWYVRDSVMDLDSARGALRRAKKAGIEIPPGRETVYVNQLLKNPALLENNKPLAGSTPPIIAKRFMEKLKRLEEEFADTKPDAATAATIRNYKRRTKLMEERSADFLSNLDQMRQIQEALAKAENSKGATSEEAAKEAEDIERDLDMKLNSRPEIYNEELHVVRDGLHIFLQDPPAMFWDRRPYEPLTVSPTEFFPNVECALIDIQPSVVNPLWRERGDGYGSPADVFELLLKTTSAASRQPLSKIADQLWPGAAEWVLPRCKSLVDPALGGRRRHGYKYAETFGWATQGTELTPRAMNATQWLEFWNEWMKWPFRPAYKELVARLADDPEDHQRPS